MPVAFIATKSALYFSNNATRVVQVVLEPELKGSHELSKRRFALISVIRFAYLHADLRSPLPFDNCGRLANW